MRTQLSGDLKILEVRGSIFQHITAISEELHSNVDDANFQTSLATLSELQDWLSEVEDYVTTRYRRSETVDAAFWRTVISKMTSRGNLAPDEEQGAGYRFWRDNSQHFESLSSLERLRELPGWVHFADFMDSFSQATKTRKFFITMDGYIGLCPAATQFGDVACLLYGAQVPFVLREEAEHYVLIGECYCHDIMDGKLIPQIDAGKLESQMFEIW